MSGKTSYLIVGSKLEDGREIQTGSKYRKASEKSIPILTEEDFEKFMQKTLDNKYFTLDNYQNWKVKKPKEVEAATKAIDIPKSVKKGSAFGGINMNMLLTEKYKPVRLSDLVGNKGSIDSLTQWLKDWDDVHVKGNKKEVKVMRGNWQNAPRVNAKAAMISGPPGIGKTSTARIVCSELGFETLEMNASDSRNKKTIESLIGTLSANNSIEYYSDAGKNRTENKFSTHKKSVIIMDEVDGIGGGDRGGVAALIQVIKITKTPIICICNDRDNRKLVSLLNHCLDIKFTRPNTNHIVKRILQIADSEGLQIEEKAAELLVEQSGHDIRQVITQIQVALTTTSSITLKDIQARLNNISKDQKLMINNFQAANKLMNSYEFNSMSYRDKMDMFFIDYDFVPLLVQENYLAAFGDNFSSKNLKDLERLAQASTYIAIGDNINKRVRADMDWTLLQECGFASSIAPCYFTQGNINFPRFPEWLGKNSTGLKSKRLINELKRSLGHRVLCDRKALQNEYLPLIFDAIYDELKNENFDAATELLDEMNISNDMFKEHIVSLIDKKKGEQMEKLNAKSKAAFTRTYNAGHKTSVVTRKKKRDAEAKLEDDQYDPEIDEPENAPSADDQDSEESDYEVVPITKPGGKGKKGKKEDKPDAKPKGKKKK